MAVVLNSEQQLFFEKWVTIEQRIFGVAAAWLLFSAVYLWILNPFGNLATVEWTPNLAPMKVLPSILPIGALLVAGVMLRRALRPELIRSRIERTTVARQELLVIVCVVLAVGMVLLGLQLNDYTELFATSLLGAGSSLSLAGWFWWRLGQLTKLNSLADRR